MVLNTLIKELQSFAINNLNVKRFHFDFKEQLNNFSSKEDTFPLCFIAPELNVNVSNNNGYYGQQMNLSIFILDRINKDRTNILTILNETNNILNDLIIWFKTNKNITITADSFVSFPINNHTTDLTAGYELSVSFLVNSISDCFNPHSKESGDICEDSTVNVYNSINTLLETLLISPGTTVNYYNDDATITVNVKDQYDNVLDSGNYTIPSGVNETEDIIVNIDKEIVLSNSDDSWSQTVTTDTVLDDTKIEIFVNNVSQGVVNIPYNKNETINIL